MKIKSLTGPMAHLGTLYDSFDSAYFLTCLYSLLTKSEKRDEIAYALYATQMCFGKGDRFSTTQTCLSTLVFDVVTHFESDLDLLLAIWARLLADSADIYQWLRNPSKYVRYSLYTTNTAYLPIDSGTLLSLLTTRRQASLSTQHSPWFWTSMCLA